MDPEHEELEGPERGVTRGDAKDEGTKYGKEKGSTR